MDFSALFIVCFLIIECGRRLNVWCQCSHKAACELCNAMQEETPQVLYLQMNHLTVSFVCGTQNPGFPESSPGGRQAGEHDTGDPRRDP